MCKSHYMDMIKNELPVDDHLVNRDSLSRWTVDVHNAVNKRLGKKELSYSEAQKLYTGMAGGGGGGVGVGAVNGVVKGTGSDGTNGKISNNIHYKNIILI